MLTPTTSKASPSNKKLKGYHFQDVSILQRVLLASALCKECLKGSLQLFQRPSGCGLATMLVLQCANYMCHAFTECPTEDCLWKGQVLQGKQEMSTGNANYWKGKSWFNKILCCNKHSRASGKEVFHHSHKGDCSCLSE